jgi:exodeoxyribonuclease-3
MKLVSWNINSVRIRINLLEKLVKEEDPDVVCLQETKVQDEQFPLEEIKKLGFKYVEFDGQKAYNGVAILSKIPLRDTNKIDVLDYNHKRHISASFLDLTVHNFYVPAGGDIPDTKLNPKFDFKLKFLDWMTQFFTEKYTKNSKLIVVGDLNIAPLENDVWSHKQLLKIVSHTPIEVEKLNKIQKSLDFVDSHRMFVSEDEKLFSWWSYRSKDINKSDRGRRLDHIWGSPDLKSRVKSAYILKNFRFEDRPSDHAPVVLELD